jgi:hypothetical protein
LSAHRFKRDVLVVVGVSLIADNLDISFTEALAVLDASQEYGSLANANSEGKGNVLVTPLALVLHNSLRVTADHPLF